MHIMKTQPEIQNMLRERYAILEWHPENKYEIRRSSAAIAEFILAVCVQTYDSGGSGT